MHHSVRGARQKVARSRNSSFFSSHPMTDHSCNLEAAQVVLSALSAVRIGRFIKVAGGRAGVNRARAHHTQRPATHGSVHPQFREIIDLFPPRLCGLSGAVNTSPETEHAATPAPRPRDLFH